ncbi:hypothetical protein B0H16DRAFT_851022 [Mycena metata]|uniref:Uncharacterized protein n=1 Tax=Mycena metata TaxID=1033252 RepID=A0AAD7IU53_9AGAR|nr:hypothetical protein B0H16DRAFT_851022 [Mycena metata]
MRGKAHAILAGWQTLLAAAAMPAPRRRPVQKPHRHPSTTTKLSTENPTHLSHLQRLRIFDPLLVLELQQSLLALRRARGDGVRCRCRRGGRGEGVGRAAVGGAHRRVSSLRVSLSSPCSEVEASPCTRPCAE